MTLPVIVSILGGTVSVLTIVGLFIGAFMYIKATAGQKGASIDDATIRQLNNSIESLERENKRLTQENTVKDQKLSSMQTQLDQQREKILKLADLVAGLAATPVAAIAPTAPAAPVLPVAAIAPIAPIQSAELERLIQEVKSLKHSLEDRV